MASEREKAQTNAVSAVLGLKDYRNILTKKWNQLESWVKEGDNPVHVDLLK